MRLSSRAFVNLLAIVGACWLLTRALILFAGNVIAQLQDPFENLQSFVSPDGQYRAIIYQQSGGGGLAPYCFDFASVVTQEVSDNEATSPRFRVLEASCGAVHVKDIKWISVHELLIVPDLNSGTSGNIDAVKLRGIADGIKVKVSYAPKHG
jgi:hypothetical protein